ncbi:hypothetical protein GCM10010176_001890 [Nonomuraea spiralis]|nr:hypothetical protein GCM10010176_001890 [Nonomuraea spiralis]
MAGEGPDGTATAAGGGSSTPGTGRTVPRRGAACTPAETGTPPAALPETGTVSGALPETGTPAALPEAGTRAKAAGGAATRAVAAMDVEASTRSRACGMKRPPGPV